MSQVTWRASDELVEHVRRVAAADGVSLNEYLTRLVRAATDPAFAENEAERLRERLVRAGLAASSGPPRAQRPGRTSVERARRAAGRGTPLSEIVVTERR